MAINFHQQPRWTRTARLHKRIERSKGKYKCVHCPATERLESGHIVPQSRSRRLRFKLWNLQLECNECNPSGNRILFNWATTKVLGRAFLTELLIKIMIIEVVYYGYWIY